MRFGQRLIELFLYVNWYRKINFTEEPQLCSMKIAYNYYKAIRKYVSKIRQNKKKPLGLWIFLVNFGVGGFPYSHFYKKLSLLTIISNSNESLLYLFFLVTLLCSTVPLYWKFSYITCHRYHINHIA